MVKERLSPLPGAPNVGEHSALGQGTHEKGSNTGAREQLATPLERPGEHLAKDNYGSHREFTQVKATLRCNTLLLLV